LMIGRNWIRGGRDAQDVPRRSAFVVGAVVAVAAVVMSVLVVGKITADPPRSTLDPAVVQAAQDSAARDVRLDRLHVAVIGDSYTGGSDMGGSGTAGWPALVAAKLQASEPPARMTMVRSGGFGYVGRGRTGNSGSTFGEMVPQAVRPTTDLIVFFGSVNDSSEQGVGAAAAKAFADAKTIAPDAKLLVVGAAWMNDRLPVSILANRDGVKEATEAAGGVFVDPIAEDWLMHRPDLIGSDLVHPTDGGHRLLADKIGPHVIEMLGVTQPAG